MINASVLIAGVEKNQITLMQFILVNLFTILLENLL